jgi:copper resistance protein C
MRTTQGILGSVVMLALIVLPTSPAVAHAELKSTDPKADGTVAAPLTQVTLTFNQPVKQDLTSVVITGPDGVAYGDGAARAVNVTVIQAVKPLPQGRVTVGWRTVSADGHSIQGQFAFTNTAAPAASPTASSPSPAPPTPAAPSDSAIAIAPRSDESSMGTVWIAAAGGLAVVAIVGGFLLLRRRSGAT